jgi:hypothetical protein
LVTQDLDITLFELRDAPAAAHRVQVHHYAIGYAIDCLAYTFKKRASLRMSAARPVSDMPGGAG